MFSGTILLDHMENMPLATQQNMLQILDRKTADMDVRFIVSTQKDLETKVTRGSFSRELYQRIGAIELEMPALRDRTEDIPMLCRYFLDQFTRVFQKQITAISDDVYAIFEAYTFPGNIRELRHIIESAVILSDSDVLGPQHLPRRLKQMAEKQPAGNQISSTGHVGTDKSFPTLHELEQNHILTALEVTQNNKTKAAEILGISRAALWRKLRIISQKKSNG
jgi:DNA-binding NtrC family response regulator